MLSTGILPMKIKRPFFCAIALLWLNTAYSVDYDIPQEYWNYLTGPMVTAIKARCEAVGAATPRIGVASIRARCPIVNEGTAPPPLGYHAEPQPPLFYRDANGDGCLNIGSEQVWYDVGSGGDLGVYNHGVDIPVVGVFTMANDKMWGKRCGMLYYDSNGNGHCDSEDCVWIGQIPFEVHLACAESSVYSLIGAFLNHDRLNDDVADPNGPPMWDGGSILAGLEPDVASATLNTPKDSSKVLAKMSAILDRLTTLKAQSHIEYTYEETAYSFSLAEYYLGYGWYWGGSRQAGYRKSGACGGYYGGHYGGYFGGYYGGEEDDGWVATMNETWGYTGPFGNYSEYEGMLDFGWSNLTFGMRWTVTGSGMGFSFNNAQSISVSRGGTNAGSVQQGSFSKGSSSYKAIAKVVLDTAPPAGAQCALYVKFNSIGAAYLDASPDDEKKHVYRESLDASPLSGYPTGRFLMLKSVSGSIGQPVGICPDYERQLPMPSHPAVDNSGSEFSVSASNGIAGASGEHVVGAACPFPSAGSAPTSEIRELTPSPTPAERVIDTNRDDIVDIGIRMGDPATETGTATFDFDREPPQVIIPVVCDPHSNLPVHAYVSQGGLGGTKNKFWTHPDADGDGLSVAYSLHSRAYIKELVVKADSHVKKVAIVRPRGCVVVFEFDWLPEVGAFREFGQPTGVNEKRTYVLRDITPTNNSDLQFDLMFDSGVVQRFNNFIQSVSRVDGLSASVPSQITGGDFIRSSNASCQLYDMALSWAGGRIQKIEYTFRFRPIKVACELAYDSNGAITALVKSLPRLSVSAVSNGSISYGNGVTVGKSGTAITTNAPGAGSVKTCQVLNSDNLPVSVSVELNGSAAVTSYVRGEGGGRYPANHVSRWGKITSITHPNGLKESFTFDSATGWPISRKTPFGAGCYMTDEFSYDNSVSSGATAAKTAYVERPRGIAVNVGDSQEAAGSMTSLSLISYSGLETIMRRAASQGATWGDASNIETKSTISMYGPPTIVTTEGTFYNSASIDGACVLTIDSNAALRGESSTKKLSPFGGTIFFEARKNNTMVDKYVATVDNSGNVISVAMLNGEVETRQYGDQAGDVTFGWPSEVALRRGAALLNKTSIQDRDAIGRPIKTSDLFETAELRYDGAGNLAESARTPKGGKTVRESFTYDAMNRLVQSSGPMGVARTVYDQGSNSRTATDTEGKSSLVVANADGSIASVSGDVPPVRYEYGHDSGKGVFTKTIRSHGASGETYSVDYKDFLGRAYRTESHTGYWSERKFDKAGRTIEEKDSSGRLTTYAYFDDGRLMQSVVNGLSTTYSYSNEYEGGRPSTTTTVTVHADTGDRVSVSKNFSDGLDSVSTVNGRTSSTTIGLLGGGLYSSTSVDMLGNKMATTTVGDIHDVRTTYAGAEWRSKLDPNGRTVSNVVPGNFEITRAYKDLTGLPERITSSDGKSTSFGYPEGSSQTRTIVSNDGTDVEIKRSALGQVEEVVGRADQLLSSKNSFGPQGDAEGLTTTGKPGEAVTRWNVDHSRNTMEKTINGLTAYSVSRHPDGRVDAISRATAADETVKKTFKYSAAPCLFAAGYSTAVTGSLAPAPEVTLANHTSFGQPRRVRTAGVCAYVLRYDSEARVSDVKLLPADAAIGPARSASYEYDNRTLSRSKAAFDGDAVDYIYDSIGLIDSVASGRIKAKYERPDGNKAIIAGLRVEVDGKVVLTRSYERTADMSRLSKVSNAGADSKIIALFEYGMAPNKSKADSLMMTDASGVASKWVYSYDDRGQLSSASLTSSLGLDADFEYDCDSIANVLSLGRMRPDGSAASTDVDLFNRVSIKRVGTKIEVRGSADSAAAVAVNDIAAARTGTTFTAMIDAGNHNSAVAMDVFISAAKFDPDATPEVGGGNSGNEGGADVTDELQIGVVVPKAEEQPVYDKGGRLSGNSVWKLTWDSEDRLLALESEIPLYVSWPGAAASLKRYVKVACVYDHAGRRLSKKLMVSSGEGTWLLAKSHSYHYDAVLLDGSPADFGVLTAETITTYSPNDQEPMTNDHYQYLWGLDLDGQYQGLGGVGGLLAVIDKTNSKIYIPIMDAQGTIHSLTDADTGAVVAHYEYDPYGRLLYESGPAKNICPFRFQSKYLDPETSLYYFGFRFYDPSSCRWLCADPMEEQGGLNLYAFCGNDPVNRVEYLGMDSMTNNMDFWTSMIGDSGDEIKRNPWNLINPKSHGNIVSLLGIGTAGALDMTRHVLPGSSKIAAHETAYQFFGDKGTPTSDLPGSFSFNGRQYEIIMMNGIWNNLDGIMDSRARLRRDLSRLSQSQFSEVGYIHNPSQGFWDIPQVMLEQVGMTDDVCRFFANTVNSKLAANPRLVMILIGHSQGGAKLNQSYDLVSPELRNRIYVITAAGAQLRGFPGARHVTRISKWGDDVCFPLGSDGFRASFFRTFVDDGGNESLCQIPDANPLVMLPFVGIVYNHPFIENYAESTANRIMNILNYDSGIKH